MSGKIPPRDEQGRFAGDDPGSGLGAMLDRSLEQKRAAQKDLRDVFFPPPVEESPDDGDEAA